LVAVTVQQLEQAALADQVQGADDDEVVLVGVQQLLYLRHPALVPIRDE